MDTTNVLFDEDESVKYDSPSEDDDDDLIDWVSEERENIKEQEEYKRENMSNFGQGVFQPTTSWGQSGTSQYNPWGGNVQWGLSQPSPAATQAPGFGTPRPTGSGWNPPFWNNNVNPQTTPGQQQYVINRNKKVIFCDFQDCLISSIDAQGKQGVVPRGIYDIYIRRDVIDKIRCFGPSWIFVLTNQNVQRGTDQELSFCRMADYVCACVADLVGLPLANVQCIMKPGLDPYDPCTKPGSGLIKIALSRISGLGITKEDLVVIGSQSGFQGQSGRDSKMAAAYGIDYVDVQQLISLYK